MKKLSFPTNLIVSLALLVSCQNAQQAGKNTDADSKIKVQDSATASDTTNKQMQSTTSGKIGNDSIESKDTNPPPSSVQAIKHGAPDQAKIDSIKQAKLKGKNKKPSSSK